MLKSIFSVPQVTDMSEFSRRGKIKIFRTNYWKFKSFFKLENMLEKMIIQTWSSVCRT